MITVMDIVTVVKKYLRLPNTSNRGRVSCGVIVFTQLKRDGIVLPSHFTISIAATVAASSSAGALLQPCRSFHSSVC